VPPGFTTYAASAPSLCVGSRRRTGAAPCSTVSSTNTTGDGVGGEGGGATTLK